MSTLAPEDVIDQLGRLADAANAGTTAPTVDGLAAGTPSPRYRRPLLVAAALLTTAVIAGVLVVAADRDPRVTTPAQDPDDTGAHLVPEVWPTGVDGQAAQLVELEPGHLSLPSFVLRRDGRAVATAQVIGFPIPRQPMTGAPGVVVDGPSAATSTTGGTTWFALQVEPGRTLLLWSALVGRDDLDAVAYAFDTESDGFRAGDLPAGWTADADPLRLASMLGSALVSENGAPISMGGPGVGSGWSEVVRTSPNGTRSLLVASRRVSDASTTVATFAQLFPTGAASVDVGLGGVLRTADDLPAYPASYGDPYATTLLWAPSEHVLAFAVARSLDTDELLTSVRSSKQRDAEEWARLHHSTTPRTDDGFRSGEKGSEIVASGAGDGYRWRVTQAPDHQMGSYARPPDDAVMTMLQVLFEEGDELSGGSSELDLGDGFWSPISTRDERHVLVQVAAPLGLRDSTLSIAGVDAAATVVDVLDEHAAITFAALPARSMPDLVGAPIHAVLTGTMPDGTPYMKSSP